MRYHLLARPTRPQRAHGNYCGRRSVPLWLLGVTIVGCLATAAAQDAAAFTRPYGGVAPVQGERPLLVILLDAASEPVSKTDAQVRALFFGGGDNVANYFTEVSNGAFTYREAFVTPWLIAQDDPDTPTDESSADWTHIGGEPHEQIKGNWVIRQVERMTPFRFRDYDANGNGSVTPDELAIVWVYRGTSGREREVWPGIVPAEGLPGGVVVPRLARGGDQSDWPLFAHELAHLNLGLKDLYVDRAATYEGVGRLSLMCDGGAPTHLDPWAKMKLGWLVPRVITSDGWVALTDSETNLGGSAVILYDPSHGTQEYFLVENRWSGASMEQGLGLDGLAVWHITEFGNPSAEEDWGRRTIRLVWAGGPPTALVADQCPHRADALFDARDPARAYALTPWSTPASLHWRDGSEASLSLWFIPEAAPLVHVYADFAPIGTIATSLDVVTAGSTSDLGAYRSAAGYALAQGRASRDVVGFGIASDDHAYVWYADGTVSSGTSRDLTAYRPAQPYVLAPGKSPADVLDMAIASDDHVYVWYADGTVSAGSSRDLASYRPAAPFALPPGYEPSDVLAIGIAKSDDHVYVWYADGMVSAGSSRDLDQYRMPYRFTTPVGTAPIDLVGIGIAASDDHVYAWFGTPGQLVAGERRSIVGAYTEGVVLAGGRTEVHAVVLADNGRPMPGASVMITADRGTFLATGGTSITGVTRANGRFDATWQAPPKDGATVDVDATFTVQATAQGVVPGRATTSILVQAEPVR